MGRALVYMFALFAVGGGAVVIDAWLRRRP